MRTIRKTEEERRVLDYLRSRDDWAVEPAEWDVAIDVDYSDELAALVTLYYDGEFPDAASDFALRRQLLERVPTVMNTPPSFVYTRVVSHREALERELPR